MSRCLAVLLLAIISVGAFAQPRTVTGTVTDINGDPMVGVNVLEKGTLNGVVTDLRDSFPTCFLSLLLFFPLLDSWALRSP